MNKIFNIFTIVFLSVMTLSLGSCTEEYEYSAADKVEGQQVYFSNALGSTLNLSDTESNFALTLNRIDTSSELTVNLTLSDESGIYSIPSSVTFAQGDSAVQFNLSYDPAKLEYDVFNSVTIAIADADYTTPYGNSSYTFSAGMPSPYVSIGKGRFSDAYLITGYVDVEIMQNQNNPNQFRVMHPYDEIAQMYAEEGYELSGEPAEYLELEILQPGDVLNGISITMQDLVYFSETATGIVNPQYGGAMSIMHPVHFKDFQDESKWSHNVVTKYQENGTPAIVQLAPMYNIEGVGGLDYSQDDEMVTITFPGYDPKDYTMGVTYLGAFSSADGDSYAMGNVTLGEDIEEAKVAVVEGNDANAALAQVISGAVETVTVTESGEVRVPCKYSGACTMVAIGYAEGEMQAYSAAAFDFTLGPSDWTTIGTGLYTDHIFCLNLVNSSTGEPAPPVQYPVQVQESNTTPGVYRILKPYAPDVYGYAGDFGYDTSKNYNIIINASDPDYVYISGQAIGISDQGDAMMICTVGGLNYDLLYPQYGEATFNLLKQKGIIKGTLKDGVISFPAGELLYSFASIYQDGMAGKANEIEATDVLVLPEAVTESIKARAMSRKANGHFVHKGHNALKNNIGRTKKTFAPMKTYQLNPNVKLNRK